MAVLRAGTCYSSLSELQNSVNALETETNAKFFKSSTVTLRNFVNKNPGHYISKSVENRADREAILEEKNIA